MVQQDCCSRPFYRENFSRRCWSAWRTYFVMRPDG
jgi:hypothetical protein